MTTSKIPPLGSLTVVLSQVASLLRGHHPWRWADPPRSSCHVVRELEHRGAHRHVNETYACPILMDACPMLMDVGASGGDGAWRGFVGGDSRVGRPTIGRPIGKI